MNIDEFYEADPRRRPSAEIELGTEWQDAQGVRYELNYVEDTGELYVMQEPPPHEWEDPFGGIHVQNNASYPDGLLVRVVGHIDTADALHTILDGWQDAIAGPPSIDWVVERLRAAGIATPAS
jgi:hypothetical protein